MAEQTVSLGPQDVIGAALIKRAEHDDAFRAELARDPFSVVERELGLLLPARIRVHVQIDQRAPRPLVAPQPVVAVPA